MEKFAKVVQKIYVILNLIGTILALSNTHKLYKGDRVDNYPSPPARIINHSQIDF